MTLFSRTVEYEAAPAWAARWFRLPLRRFALERDKADRFWFPVTVFALLVLYLLLQNPYWVPAGDSELYAAVARSLATGKGYRFNGQHVAMIPPGWSLLMAGVMKLTNSFLALKLLTMTCMLGSLACDYWILRRFASPARTALAVVLTGTISHLFQATYWLISEGSFCLSVSAAVLLALQVAEGRRAWWRGIVITFLCIAAVSIRWAGVLSMLLVVAALLDGQWRPRLNWQWVLAVIAIVITIATFAGLRRALRPSPGELAIQSDVMMGSGEDIGTSVDEAPVTGAANQTARAYRLIPRGSIVDRLVNWGCWYSWLFWQPFRAAGASRVLGAIAILTGWAVLLLTAVTTIVACMQRRWLWLAMGGYCGVLALGWPSVNARYYVPVAFLITLGVLLGVGQLQIWTRNAKLRKWISAGGIAFVASLVLCNGALYGVEVSVARSAHFAQRYETGLNMSLISAGEYLMNLPDPPKDGEIAVSGRYTNMDHSRPSPFALRVLALLTDRVIQTPRYKITNVVPTSSFHNGKILRRWLYEDIDKPRVKWYLYQPPISPWRIWHFRLGWYQKWQTGRAPKETDSVWHLYKVVEEKPEKGKHADPGAPPEVKLIEVIPPQVTKYPTRIPGL